VSLAKQNMKRQPRPFRIKSTGRTHEISDSLASNEQVAGAKGEYEIRMRILREHGLDPNTCSAEKADEVLHDLI